MRDYLAAAADGAGGARGTRRSEHRIDVTTQARADDETRAGDAVARHLKAALQELEKERERAMPAAMLARRGAAGAGGDACGKQADADVDQAAARAAAAARASARAARCACATAGLARRSRAR